MREGYAFALAQRRKRTEVIEVIGGKLGVCPRRGGKGIRVEPCKLVCVIRRDIVIACENDIAMIPHPPQALHRFRPITDHVTETPERVPIAHIRDHRVEGLFIRMDVRNNQNARHEL